MIAGKYPTDATVVHVPNPDGIKPLDLRPQDPPDDFIRTGFRVPVLIISPFAKPHYVSHEVSDHTSVLALIEKRFMVPFNREADNHPHLTRRDQFANALEDMFDFENSPSLNTAVGAALPPTNDCGPFAGVATTP